MKNLPPRTYFVISLEEIYNISWKDGMGRHYVDHQQENAMQEALTAEWLISICAMPDPSDFWFSDTLNGWMGSPWFRDWNYCYEDKDPHGKPEHYKVKR